MKKIISIIMVVMVVFLIGGCSKMTGTPSKEEMIKVVKSEEAKRVIEKNLKNLIKKKSLNNILISTVSVSTSKNRTIKLL